MCRAPFDAHGHTSFCHRCWSSPTCSLSVPLQASHRTSPSSSAERAVPAKRKRRKSSCNTSHGPPAASSPRMSLWVRSNAKSCPRTRSWRPLATPGLSAMTIPRDSVRASLNHAHAMPPARPPHKENQRNPGPHPYPGLTGFRYARLLQGNSSRFSSARSDASLGHRSQTTCSRKPGSCGRPKGSATTTYSTSYSRASSSGRRTRRRKRAAPMRPPRQGVILPSFTTSTKAAATSLKAVMTPRTGSKPR